MHGRRKTAAGQGPSDAEVAEQTAKYTKYLSLLRAAVGQTQQPYGINVVKFSWSSLLCKSERSQARYKYHTGRPRFCRSSPDEATVHTAVAAEMALTQNALQTRNPKSYGAWHHRKWMLTLCCTGTAPGVDKHLSVLEQPPSSSAVSAAEEAHTDEKSNEDPIVAFGRCAPWLKTAASAAAELQLCSKFLTLDERNFHCWKHRRFVVQIGDVPLEEELVFTDELIERNFSNYSAWHYRSSLLERLGEASLQRIQTEFEKLKQAMYTEPDDQTAWFYHRWLVTWGSSLASSGSDQAAQWLAHLQEQLQEMQTLHTVEPSSKWPVHAAAFLKRFIATQATAAGVTVPVAAVDTEDYAQLAEMDTWHAGFYRHAASGTGGAFFGL